MNKENDIIKAELEHITELMVDLMILKGPAPIVHDLKSMVNLKEIK